MIIPLAVVLGFSQYVFLMDSSGIHQPLCPREQLRAKEDNLLRCLKSNPDVYEFFMSIFMLGSDKGPYNTFKQRCNLRSEIDDCLVPFIDTVTDCINPVVLKGMPVWKKIDQQVLDYFCKNNTEILYDIFKKGPKSCWDDGVENALKMCSKKINVSTSIYDIKEITQHCSEFEEFETCFRSAMSLSCPKDTAELITPVVQMVEQNLCNDVKVN